MDSLKTNRLHQGGAVQTTGQPLEAAEAAVILIHGRGASAADMLELARALYQPGFVYLAPQAANHTWYPYSFLAPIERNEPWLSSALQAIADLLVQTDAAGIPVERTVLAGFSQGACLAAEFVARNARRYGGLLVFSGGLIGPPGAPRDYPGSLAGTPAFIGCSDSDPHIPLERVRETTATLERLGARVSEIIYPNLGHTITGDQVDRAMEILREVIPGG